MIFKRYARFVTRYPYVLIVLDVVLALILGPVTVWYYGFPDFSEPTKGFEPRGTEIRGRSTALTFVNSKLSDGTFSLTPTGSDGGMADNRRRRKRRKAGDLTEICAAAASDTIRNPKSIPRLVVGAVESDNLFKAEHLRNLCEWEEEFIHAYWPDRPCDAISVGRFVAAFKDKPCSSISDQDLSDYLDVLVMCAPYYFRGELTVDCEADGSCPGLPTSCTMYNAVYLTFHLLTDSEFMENGDTTKTDLKYSLIFIPETLYDYDGWNIRSWFFDSLDGKSTEGSGLEVLAMDLRIDFDVFSTYLVADLPWFGVAMVLVIVVLLFYLRSFALMLTVVLNVLFTICISYFVYFFIFRFLFFPFINLLVFLLLIAVGADDVFILYDMWRQETRKHPDAALEDVMSETLKHGAASILVTSLTTAAALMANLISDITALKCFGVFAGICMIVTFLLMITWVPAVIVIVEKVSRCCCKAGCSSKLESWKEIMNSKVDYFWEEIMTRAVVKMWLLWLIVFLALGIAGIVVVFVRPGLSLPSSTTIDFFSPSHPFTKYDKEFKDHFRFENETANDDLSNAVWMEAVWGVEGVDNGNFLDSDSLGTLVTQPIDLYDRDAQVWMLEFCESLKNQPFVSSLVENGQCYMELFKSLVEGRCSYVVPSVSNSSLVQLTPCCGLTFPVSADLAETCIKLYASLTQGDYSSFSSALAGQPVFVIGKPVFQSGDLVMFSSLFETNVGWTAKYDVMDGLYARVRSFMEEALVDVPAGLEGGWFTSLAFDFYDLQKSLASGTMSGIGVALAVGFVILLVTSLNVVITVYAIVTITLVIAVTVAVLVLLGWELNLFESLTITLSIGLSIDFTIHYGVTYKMSTETTRAARVKHVLVTVGSAVAMAAITTFLSGVAVMPGRVLSYRQFGIFLMLIMTISWVMSTFFFLALCSVIGPLGHTGDLVYLFKICLRRGTRFVGVDDTCDSNDTETEGKVQTNSEAGNMHI